MRMQAAAAGFAVLLLAACTQTDAAAVDGDPHAEQIACATNGARDYSETCLVERATVDGLSTIVIRHPDGGFRRLEFHSDGEVTAADGSQASVAVHGANGIDLTLGNDRYRFESGLKSDDR